MDRENWSSRAAFIVAAIGSAIGFGNVWRFPTLAYEFGGGAFFIPYLLALFIIGIPILILEVSVGQYYQTGDAGAFGKVNKRFRGVGLGSVFCAFVVTTYYCVLIAWVLRMFVYSCIGSEGKWKGVSATEAVGWFVGTVTGTNTAYGVNNDIPNNLVGANVGALAIVWLVIFLSLAFGVKWTGRIAYFTVGLPIVFLFVLLIRAVTLDGAGDGVKAYIGEWDMSVLSDKAEVWSKAVTQVFFSIGVTFGIMTAYASYNKRNSPVFSNSLIIALSNSFYSFIAGFAVFGTVGYIAKRDGVKIEDLQSVLGGPPLIFATYPVGLSTLSGHGHWERLLFVCLFLLGIDSAFALTEGVSTVFHDTRLLHKVPRAIVTGGVCLIGFLCGLLYCTDTGLLFLDTADHYINFMMLMVGFLECIAIGWVFGIGSQIEKLGPLPVLTFFVGTFTSVCFGSAFWFGSETGAVWKGFVALCVSYVLIMGLVVFLCFRAKATIASEMTWWELVYELLMGNVMLLRRQLVGVVRYIPWLWFFLIRHVIPPLLLILFANLAVSENAKTGEREFGNYENYPSGYQALGISIFVFTCILIVSGLFLPDLYACFSISTFTEETEKDTETTAKDVDAPADEEENSKVQEPETV